MTNESIIAVPPNVDNPIVLRKFLSTLVERLDTVLGFRGVTAAATTSQLEETDATLASVSANTETNSQAIVSLNTAVETNATDIETNAADIDTLETYWTHEQLSSTYYDLDNAAWGSLVGNHEFATDGANISNAPYTASGGTTYRNFVHSVPTLGGGIVQRLVVIYSGTTIEVFQRAGDTFSEATTIGWKAL